MAKKVETIVASVTPKSRTGLSIYTDAHKLNVDTVADFRPTPERLVSVKQQLVAAGFTIESESPMGVTISGTRALFESEFGADIRKKTYTKAAAQTEGLVYYTSGRPLVPSGALGVEIEKVELVMPALPLLEGTPPPSKPGEYRLEPTVDLPTLLAAKPLHTAGKTGVGVKVALVDTGIYARLTEKLNAPAASLVLNVDQKVRAVKGVFLASDTDHTGTNFFTGGSFAAKTITLATAPPPGELLDVVYSTLHPHFERDGRTVSFGTVQGVIDLDGFADELGHGTTVAANLLAIAPGVTLSVLKFADRTSSYPLPAVQLARAANPDIIVCAWRELGGSRNLPLEAEIVDAVASGKLVVFPSGNGDTDAMSDFPIAHPEVLSVGGGYPIPAPAGGFRAASMASSFDSVFHTQPPRHVPDIVGIVGEKPIGNLIVLPTQPKSSLDVGQSATDNTAPDDGWCVTGGTSAAAGQIAGVAALLLEKHPGLKPRAVKNILENTALDVTAGSSGSTPPQSAGPGWDQATGFGVVQAEAAVNFLQTGFNAFIRDSLADDGIEPTRDASRLWASPDIVIRNLTVDDLAELGPTVKHRQDLSDVVEDGQTNFVYLRVQNRGDVKGNCTAKVYFTDPGMFGTPSAWTTIGTAAIADLEPGEFRAVGPIQWDDAKIPTAGHYCLIAILDSASDPAPNLATVTTAQQFVDMVVNKNNVAWRNVEVIDVARGQSRSYEFYVEGPADHDVVGDLEINLSEFFPDAPVMVRVLKRVVSDTGLVNLTRHDENELYVNLQHRGGLGIVKNMPVKARERIKVVITYTVPETALGGEHPIRARFMVGGMNLGGYTHVVRLSMSALIGNRNTMELHRIGCPWEARMATYHRVAQFDIARAHAQGYDNCAVCLKGSTR